MFLGVCGCGGVLATLSIISNGGLPDPPTLEESLAELNSGGIPGRHKGLRHLANISPQPQRREVAKALVRVALDEGEAPNLRVQAIELLGRWGNESDVPALEQIQDAIWPKVKKAAAAAAIEVAARPAVDIPVESEQAEDDPQDDSANSTPRDRFEELRDRVRQRD